MVAVTKRWIYIGRSRTALGAVTILAAVTFVVDMDGGAVRNHLPENPLRALPLLLDLRYRDRDERRERAIARSGGRSVVRRRDGERHRRGAVGVRADSRIGRSGSTRERVSHRCTSPWCSSLARSRCNVHLLCENQPLTDLYGLTDARDAGELACVISGYNHWDYGPYS